MAKKQYDSPQMSVDKLYEEDVLTASNGVWYDNLDGSGQGGTVGSFDNGWLSSNN